MNVKEFLIGAGTVALGAVVGLLVYDQIKVHLLGGK